jgi:hypothetical protein
MARQAVLTREPAPRLWAIVDESVVRRSIGGADVIRHQLRRLVGAAELSMITIQVLPFAAGAHRGLTGSFVVLEFAGTTEHPLVYCEGMTGGVIRSKPEELRGYWVSFEALKARVPERTGFNSFHHGRHPWRKASQSKKGDRHGRRRSKSKNKDL